jgi:hypothetical protein
MYNFQHMGGYPKFRFYRTAVMNENFTRHVFVADMLRMPGDSHTAENIKEAFEKMVMEYILMH